MHYTPYLLPLLFSTLILGGLGAYAWRYREVPTAIPFSLAMAAAALWALTSALGLASLALADKVFWMKARFLPIVCLPTLWLVVVARYAGHQHALSRRRLAALLIVPAITGILAWTSDAHALFRYNYRLDTAGPFPILLFDEGPWFWIHVLYSYGLNLATIVILLRSLRGAHPVYIRQTLVILTGIAVPLAADALYILGVTPLRGYNLAPSLFFVSGLAFGWALFRYRLLDIVPIARGAVVANMTEAVLVLDGRGRLVDYNPSARDLFGLEAAHVIGQPVERVLKAWPELLGQHRDGRPIAAELSLGPAERRRTYASSVTPITQSDGRPAGCLILLRDITEHIQAEAQLRESEEWFRMMVDAAPFPLALTRLSDNTILYLNPKAAELFGASPAEAVGQPATDFYADPADRAALVAEALRTGFVREREIQLRGINGEPIWALLSAIVAVFRGEQILLVSASDITQRRQAEQAEREQRALAEALRDTAAALSAALSFDDVLDRLLANVGRVVPHDMANIMLFNEQREAYVARARGYAEHGLTEVVQALRMSLSGSAYFQKMIATGEPVIVPDVRADPAWIVGPSQRWIRSYAAMPIRVRGQVVGFLNLDSATPGFFTPVHVERLRAFADQAATAVENARLYDEVHRRADELTVLNRINLAITSGLDLQRVLPALFGECQRVLPMDVFYVAVYDSATALIHHPLFYDRGEYLTPEVRDIRVRPGLSGEVILSRQTLYLPDTLDPATAQAHEIVHLTGELSRSYVGVPLVFRGEAVGVISMQSYAPNAYTQEQIRLLETIATQVATVIENARLYEAAQKELAERRQAEEALRQANERLQVQLATIEALQIGLREQAMRDPLTGLFNRRYLQESLGRELARAAREDYPVCLVIMDLDHFKKLNDTHGHQAGDLVLQALGHLLLSQTRRSDIACRLGGEEFVVVLPGANLAIAHARAEQWRVAFEALRIDYISLALQSTFSTGIAAFPDHGATGDAVLAAADRALYRAKAAGRNRTVVWE